MQQNALLTAARELYAVHGILPVAAAGKAPMGGAGWNTLPLETRLLYFDTPVCTGLGFQAGLIFHPVLGPCIMRVLDVDEKDEHKRTAFVLMFLHLLGNDAKRIVWRWGRGPACVIFTHGEHTRERYGSIQFLGPGKYAVGWGAHPDVGTYRWPDGDIFKVMPPLLDVKKAEACILAACAYAGIVVAVEHSAIKAAPPITEQQLNALSDNDLARYHAELTDGLATINGMAVNTGRGTALYNLGLRFGALARHDTRLGDIVNSAIATLPGHKGQGDVRDFSRGLDESKGLAQQRTAEANTQRNQVIEALKPKGAHAPGQQLNELLQENIPPLRWLIDRYLPHVGTLSLVGKPKIGKSFLILEMALAIAEGGFFWGEQCHRAGALLYMLEDGKRRIKERIGKLRPHGLNVDTMTTFRIRYGKDGPFRVHPDGSGGLLDDIRKHKHDYPDIGIVLIDMWKMVRGQSEKGLDAYQATSQLVAPISALAQELDITILIVHHARKGKIDPDDVGDAASGSNALQGATEGSWTIWKQEVGARIIAEVRESENFDLQLEKKEGQLVWNPIETTTGNQSTVKDRVLNALAAANCELSPSDVSLRLKLSLPVVNARLHDLRNEGAIQSPRHGTYRVPGARSRFEGIVSALTQMAIIKPVTTELRMLHDPDGALSRLNDQDATGFAYVNDVVETIELTGFADGRSSLNALNVRKLTREHKGVVWFFGTAVNRTAQPLPWAINYPWST